ncbi:DUF7257 domain-containing protein [Nocardia shimofusensis]|uniref:DUF7257 domain-containing protein n=1 Tax=Nocardia shimofusensis TaxID=228596 RepID=UPI0008307324|nr:hypothetical protein [Nocardia shimofusensis]
MTSPDGRIPSGAYTGGSIRNLQKVTWEAAQASIMSNVMQSFAGIDAVGSNLSTVTNRALDAAASAQTDATDAQVTATAAQGTSVSNASAIADLQADKTQSEVGGAAFTDKFETWDAAKWNVGKWSSGGHTVPDVAVVDHQAGIAKTDHTSTGGAFALYKTPLMTDSQSVSLVLGRPNQAGSFTGSGILLRAADDLSTFVIAQVGASRISLQRGTLVDGQLTITVWAERTNLTLSSGDTVTVSASGSSYEVLVNGVSRFGYQDTAVTSPVGAGNRRVGFFSACNVSSTWSGTTLSFGFDLESFVAADTTSPPLVGTGWSLYRQSATTVAHSAGNARYGAVFDTIRSANKVNVRDLSTGQIQITKPGWYVMNVGVQWSQACGTGYSYRVALWSAPSPDGLWKLVRNSGEVEGSAVYRTSGSFVVFAGAGSVWAPGYYIAGANNMYGDPSGTNVYFDGTLCSYS